MIQLNHYVRKSILASSLKKLSTSLIILPFIALSSGCENTSEEITTEALTQVNISDQENIVWTLSSFDTSSGAEPVLEDTKISLAMNIEDKKIEGVGGCNSYLADFSLNEADATVTISNVISTEMWCAEPEGVMQQEQDYFTALMQVESLILDYTLTLINGESTNMTFVKEEPDNEEIIWQLDAFESAAGTLALIDTTHISLSIDWDNKQLNGTGGCNTYTANFESDEVNNTMAISNISSTEKWCTEPGNIMQQEQDYLSDLLQAQSYRVDGDKFTLEIDEMTSLHYTITN